MKKWIIILSIILFSLLSFSFAKSPTAWTDSSLVDYLQFLIETLYVITWPLIIIAWKAMSNTFVYGKIFYMDIFLEKVWQLVRWFANIALWVVFIASIFAYFMNIEKFNVKKIWWKLVIAALLVNISWFLVATLIDLSTILSVWVTQIANNIMSVNDEVDKKAVFTKVVINLDENKIEMPKTICMYTEKYGALYNCIQSCKDGYKEISKWTKQQDACKNWKDFAWSVITLDDIKKAGEDLSWPLFELFRFVNNAALFSNNISSSVSLIVAISKIVLLAMLLIPLIWFSIVFIIRIVILWIVIMFSPIILMWYTLWIWTADMKAKINDIIWIIFMPVFMSIVLALWVVFVWATTKLMPTWQNKDIASSIWIEVKENKINFPVEQVLWKPALTLEIDNKKQEQNENYSPITTWLWGDIQDAKLWIWWVIVCLLSSIVLWILFLTAMNITKITKRIVQPIEKIVKGAVKSAPILPKWQSIWSAKLLWEHVSSLPSKYVWTRSQEVQQKIKEIFDKQEKKWKLESDRSDSKKKKQIKH